MIGRLVRAAAEACGPCVGYLSCKRVRIGVGKRVDIADNAAIAVLLLRDLRDHQNLSLQRLGAPVGLRIRVLDDPAQNGGNRLLARVEAPFDGRLGVVEGSETLEAVLQIALPDMNCG